MNRQLFALIWIVLASAGPIAAQEATTGKPAPSPTAVARATKAMETLIATQDFEEAMPFAKLLAGLEARLPKDSRITLRVDDKAFGKERAVMLATPAHLPSVPKQMTLGTALRLAISQVTTEPIDFAIRPGGILITEPRLAAYVATYQIRDLIDELPHLHAELARSFFRDAVMLASKHDGTELLMAALGSTARLEPWETMQIVNSARLTVFAAPHRHSAISSLLTALRRFADVHVIMNARLYAVDRAFYAKHIAPLFPDAEPGGLRAKPPPDRRIAMSIEGALLKKILKQKRILESDDRKLRADAKTRFLALQTAIRYTAGVPLGKREPCTGTVLAGVTFDVQPTVSPDRRFLRLAITQNTCRLAGITRGKRLRLDNGADEEIEVPAVERGSVTATVDVADGDPLLMPVDYRPAGKEHAGKVWLLVARPVVWIQEEEDQVKAGDIAPVRQQSIWDSSTSKEEEGPPPPALLLTDEVKDILQAVTTDVLTNPDLKLARAPFEKAKQKLLTLVNGAKIGWPREFSPGTHGYQLLKSPLDPFERPCALRIRLERFDFKRKHIFSKEAAIEIRVDTTGSSFGGSYITYVARRVGQRWRVEVQDDFP